MKTKRPNLQEYLLKYLNTRDGFVKKVDLYVVGDQIEFSPESVGRILRLLEREGKLKVLYYDGLYSKHLAKYACNDVVEPVKVKVEPRFEMRNGVMIAVF